MKINIFSYYVSRPFASAAIRYTSYTQYDRQSQQQLGFL